MPYIRAQKRAARTKAGIVKHTPQSIDEQIKLQGRDSSLYYYVVNPHFQTSYTSDYKSPLF